ncbi:hypothetical protein COCVIDRAFT_88141 [Bipolaris victoriae FI3]|uniref:Uncharacterized protein n=1 Tax=Bipolaris victoriae (strain FI3) TaxID=930091 RepID=W7EZG6_BIPV3|nr:hypothetical protein COCVIDRAFT_88141 [Bipolaris victoriae FI3]
MLKRGSAIAKRQGYYPTTGYCDMPGDTCQEACGAEYVECPTDGSFTSCHSTTDGTHCCTDGTGNACGAGDYCTHDASGSTYCCPQNLNAEECAKELGLDVPLIPDSAETSTPIAVPTGVSDSVAVPSPSPTEVEEEEEEETSSGAVVSPSSTPAEPSPSPSSARASSSTRTAASQSVALPSVTSSSARLPNATSTGPGLPQFTGGAAKIAGSGAVMFAAVAGLVVL